MALHDLPDWEWADPAQSRLGVDRDGRAVVEFLDASGEVCHTTTLYRPPYSVVDLLGAWRDDYERHAFLHETQGMSPMDVLLYSAGEGVVRGS